MQKCVGIWPLGYSISPEKHCKVQVSHFGSAKRFSSNTATNKPHIWEQYWDSVNGDLEIGILVTEAKNILKDLSIDMQKDCLIRI